MGSFSLVTFPLRSRTWRGVSTTTHLSPPASTPGPTASQAYSDRLSQGCCSLLTPPTPPAIHEGSLSSFCLSTPLHPIPDLPGNRGGLILWSLPRPFWPPAGHGWAVAVQLQELVHLWALGLPRHGDTHSTDKEAEAQLPAPII